MAEDRYTTVDITLKDNNPHYRNKRVVLSSQLLRKLKGMSNKESITIFKSDLEYYKKD